MHEILCGKKTWKRSTKLSLDFKSLYTSDPVKEAINIARRLLYARDDKPGIPTKPMERLHKLTVTNVHFNCNES